MPHPDAVVMAPSPLIVTAELLAALAPHPIAAGVIASGADLARIVHRVVRPIPAGADGGRNDGSW